MRLSADQMSDAPFGLEHSKRNHQLMSDYFDVLCQGRCPFQRGSPAKQPPTRASKTGHVLGILFQSIQSSEHTCAYPAQTGNRALEGHRHRNAEKPIPGHGRACYCPRILIARRLGAFFYFRFSLTVMIPVFRADWMPETGEVRDLQHETIVVLLYWGIQN